MRQKYKTISKSQSLKTFWTSSNKVCKEKASYSKMKSLNYSWINLKENNWQGVWALTTTFSIKKLTKTSRSKIPRLTLKAFLSKRIWFLHGVNIFKEMAAWLHRCFLVLKLSSSQVFSLQTKIKFSRLMLILLSVSGR